MFIKLKEYETKLSFKIDSYVEYVLVIKNIETFMNIDIMEFNNKLDDVILLIKEKQ
jgi:hypothetical protein